MNNTAVNAKSINNGLMKGFKMNKISKFNRCLLTITAVAFILLSITGISLSADSQEWDKTFAKNDKVIHEKVAYQNR